MGISQEKDMRGGRTWTLIVALGLASVVAACTSRTESAVCDRACLIGITEAYLAAMAAGDASQAPVASTVRFTENTRELALGQGAWERITGVRDYRLYVADAEAGQVALYTVIDGDERPGLLALRVKVEDQLITEVESVHVGIGQTGFGSVDTLVEAAPVWTEVLPAERRRSRDDLIDIADRYFETLEKQLIDHVPFTDDCLRIENGVQTAGRTDGQGLAALGCRENVNHPIWTYITAVNPRRYLVVDEERGLVSGMFMFRHGGTYDSYTLPSGEVVPLSEAARRRQSVVIAELFKIDDGRIRRIEAVMAGGLDLEAPSGWDEQ
jgi:hypothetical protein